MPGSVHDSEIAIIGAGPAGMAAAITAADHGASVLLLDEQPGPGGQIYRGVTNAAAARGDLLGADYLAGRRLTDRLDQPLIDYRPGGKVWRVDDDGQILFEQGESPVNPSVMTDTPEKIRRATERHFGFWITDFELSSYLPLVTSSDRK